MKKTTAKEIYIVPVNEKADFLLFRMLWQNMDISLILISFFGHAASRRDGKVGSRNLNEVVYELGHGYLYVHRIL